MKEKTILRVTIFQVNIASTTRVSVHSIYWKFDAYARLNLKIPWKFRSGHEIETIKWYHLLDMCIFFSNQTNGFFFWTSTSCFQYLSSHNVLPERIWIWRFEIHQWTNLSSLGNNDELVITRRLLFFVVYCSHNRNSKEKVANTHYLLIFIFVNFTFWGQQKMWFYFKL